MNISQIKRVLYSAMKYLRVFEAVSRAIRTKSITPLLSFFRGGESWRR